jgi:hypothetical protein
VTPGCPADEMDVGLFNRQADSTSPDYDPNYTTNPDRGFGSPDHPFGLYVGDFTSLEQAGIGKPYHMYSFWTHTNTYDIPYSGWS